MIVSIADKLIANEQAILQANNKVRNENESETQRIRDVQKQSKKKKTTKETNEARCVPVLD